MISFDYREWPAPKLRGKPKAAQVLEAEGKYVLSKLESGDRLILLDEGGKQFDSRGLADWLEEQLSRSPGRLILLIGGAYGFSPLLYSRAEAKLSLGKLTFSHQLVRVMTLEQVYRAFTILRDHPYHND